VIKTSLASGLALALALTLGAPAHAQLGPVPVIDISAIQKMVQELQQMEQIYSTTVQELQTLQNAYKQILIAGQTLSPAQLAQMTNVLNQVQQLPNIQNQIANIDASILQQFERDFPTYKPDANYPTVLATLSANTNASVADAYNQVQAQNGNMQLESNWLSQLLLNANGATGEMQALSAANGFLAMLNEQMLKLRQIQLAMLRNQSAWIKTSMANVANGSGSGGGGVTNNHSADTAWLYWLSQSGLAATSPK
jgi:P-type conjugative transfer protein TrbJ